jgi:hypothetical protein
MINRFRAVACADRGDMIDRVADQWMRACDTRIPRGRIACWKRIRENVIDRSLGSESLSRDVLLAIIPGQGQDCDYRCPARFDRRFRVKHESSL